MRYIGSYENAQAIQEAVDGGTLGKPYVAYDEAMQTIDWNGRSETDYSKQYLTIEALEDGVIKRNLTNVYYSVNEGEWTLNGRNDITVRSGDEVRFKSSGSDMSNLFSGNTLSFNAYGNILSLEFGDNFVGHQEQIKVQSCFRSSGVKNIANLVLPSITFTVNSVYAHMFRDCTGLTDASLYMPALTLTEEAYAHMFRGCTNLVSPPTFNPSADPYHHSFGWMFLECRSLTTAPELPATNIRSCTGPFEGMFNGCTSLTTVPSLPRTSLTNYCYMNMFSGCTSLNYIKCLATSGINYNFSTTNWVVGVGSTGTFVKHPNATWPTGVDGIPSGWTVIDAEI